MCLELRREVHVTEIDLEVIGGAEKGRGDCGKGQDRKARGAEGAG